MNRLIPTLICDLRLQYRNGFYFVIALVVAIWAALASQVPHASLGWLLPGLVAGNLLVNTFYFVAGLVLLEKGEGTLEAQVVTPLRSREYLASKVITLAALALVENVLVVAMWNGLNFNLLPLAVGLLLASALYVLVGFTAVIRYDSVNDFLMPSVLFTTLLLLPLVDYFGLFKSWAFYLHPVQAGLLLMKAAFEPVETWQCLYGLGYIGLWIVLFSWLGLRAFRRFIVTR